MAATPTPEAANAITDIARRHDLSRESVLAMLVAMHRGGGTMAQFNIPELGGSGQWMRGGMTMVGNMFDNALKARVDALCAELSRLLSTTTVFPPSATQDHVGFASAWWPPDFGMPSSTGAQNDTRYAVFPTARRLAIQIDGVTRVFDTGEHRIGGVQQQQGGGYATVGFTSQLGTFSISTLRQVGSQAANPTEAPPRPAAAASPPPPASPAPETPSAAQASGDPATIFAAIESLAGLHERGILSDAEFAAKKAELLARL